LAAAWCEARRVEWVSIESVGIKSVGIDQHTVDPCVGTWRSEVRQETAAAANTEDGEREEEDAGFPSGKEDAHG
jgi:hypothetical protein